MGKLNQQLREAAKKNNGRDIKALTPPPSSLLTVETSAARQNKISFFKVSFFPFIACPLPPPPHPVLMAWSIK